MIGTILDISAPTVMANGDPIPPGLITGYRIYRGTTSGNMVGVLDVSAATTQIAFADIPGAVVGHWFAVTALSDLGESIQSAAAQWTGTGITATLTLVAHPVLIWG